VLKIRLRRMGAKKKPTYRVVVAESTAPRDGVYVEMLGVYNPRTEPSTFQVDADKTRDWLRKGAQPTDRVARLLAKTGITAV
jgi:small subunit ribosomal protein S16